MTSLRFDHLFLLLLFTTSFHCLIKILEIKEESSWTAPQKYQICEADCISSDLSKVTQQINGGGALTSRWHKLAIIESTLFGGHYVYGFL